MVQSHFDILQHLMSEDLTMSQLSDKISKTKPTVTTLIKRLKESGYVISFRSSEDERIHKVQITNKGKLQAEWAKKTLSAYELAVSEKVDLNNIKEAIQLMVLIKNAIIEFKESND